MKFRIYLSLIIAITFLFGISEAQGKKSNKKGIQTVKIGTQVWMKKNLDVAHYCNGDPIRHCQTDEEWAILTEYLGGKEVAGGKMKEAGTKHWLEPNEGATNKSKFSAVPGGCRSLNGTFDYVGSNCYWWSSSEGNAASAWFRNLYYNSSTVGRSLSNEGLGFSVRCVRD